MIAVFLGLAAVTAVTDWWSVASERRGVENFAKPLVMVWLIALALTIDADPSSARPLIVAGLVAGLAGDIFLLPTVDKFLAGLTAFLVGHLLYIAGLIQIRSTAPLLVAGLIAGAVLMIFVGRPILRGAHGTSYFVPVIVYMAAVAGLVVVGIYTGRWLLALGATAFALSDGLLGSDKFVAPAPQRRVYIHVLYHLGQAGLVLGLASTFA